MLARRLVRERSVDGFNLHMSASRSSQVVPSGLLKYIFACHDSWVPVFTTHFLDRWSHTSKSLRYQGNTAEVIQAEHPRATEYERLLPGGLRYVHGLRLTCNY